MLYTPRASSCYANVDAGPGPPPSMIGNPDFFNSSWSNGARIVDMHAASLEGSTLLVICHANARRAVFPGVTDNLGGNWTAGPQHEDLTGDSSWGYFYRANAPAGVTDCTVNRTGDYGYTMLTTFELTHGTIQAHGIEVNGFGTVHYNAPPPGLTTPPCWAVAGGRFSNASGTWNVTPGWTPHLTAGNQQSLQSIQAELTADRVLITTTNSRESNQSVAAIW